MKKILVKDFTATNKESLKKLKERDSEVFDLTVTLLAELAVLEKRIEQENLLKPMVSKTTSNPKPKVAKPKVVKPKSTQKVDLTIAEDEFDF